MECTIRNVLSVYLAIAPHSRVACVLELAGFCKDVAGVSVPGWRHCCTCRNFKVLFVDQSLRDCLVERPNPLRLQHIRRRSDQLSGKGTAM